jgi:hypothetical protein
VDNSSIQELTELLKGIWEEINCCLQQGCKKYEQPAQRKKNGTESAFPLDRSIIARLYEGKICENMNNLRSGRGLLPSGSLSPGIKPWRRSALRMERSLLPAKGSTSMTTAGIRQEREQEENKEEGWILPSRPNNR